METKKVLDYVLAAKPEYSHWGNGCNDLDQYSSSIRIRVWFLTDVREYEHHNLWELLDRVNSEWKQRFVEKKLSPPDFQGDLKQFYSFKNRMEISEFLSVHKELYEVLIETHGQITRIFKDNINELYLKLENDPEEDFEALFVIIKTNLSPSAALALLNRLDEEWFLDHVSGEIASIFTITVELM